MKPLMVLAHGTRTTKEQWAGYDTHLKNADLLAIDLPGHGSLQGQRCEYDDVIEVFDTAIATAKPEQPVIVGGHSLGGYLAGMYTQHLTQHKRIGEISGLVLIGTTADPASPLAAVYKGFAKLLPHVGYERMTKIANMAYRALGMKDGLPGPEAYEALADSWALVFEHCGPRNLREVNCPVVFINGQFDQMRIHVNKYTEQSPGATAHVIRGASHVLTATHPKQLAEILDTLAGTVAAKGHLAA